LRRAARNALLLVTLVLASTTAILRAQAPAADPWGFSDEPEAVETWTDILRPQWIDIGLTAALIGLALASFSRRSKPLKYATLAATVAYLGVTKGTMVSVTDLFRFVDSIRAVTEIPGGTWSASAVATAAASAFPEFKRGIAWYMFATFTLASTLVWGRFYCGRMCAFGAFTQILDAVVPKAIRRNPPLWLERRASYIKFGLLLGVLIYFAVTHDMFVYRYVEPFWMFTGLGNVTMWTLLGVLLVATLVVRNLYCRFLCPVGAALGVIAKVTTLLPIKRWSECKSCKLCERACEWGAIQGPAIVKTECVRCDDCERIYRDKATCVHWLIITKKEKWAAAGIKGNQPAGVPASPAL
jgi:hypothetical protein